MPFDAQRTLVDGILAEKEKKKKEQDVMICAVFDGVMSQATSH